MPKSISTIQNQIAGCERNIEESLQQCSAITGNKNFQFSFDLSAFVNGITTCDLDDTVDSMNKVQELFNKCEKIVVLEKKRRNYTKEFRKIIADRERRERVKRLTMHHSFKKNALSFKIPTPLNSQESTDIQDEGDLN